MTENNDNCFSFGSSVFSQFYLFPNFSPLSYFLLFIYLSLYYYALHGQCSLFLLDFARICIPLYSQISRNLEAESLLLALVGHKLLSFKNLLLKQQLFTWNNTILNASSSMPRPHLLENQEVICRLKEHQKA